MNSRIETKCTFIKVSVGTETFGQRRSQLIKKNAMKMTPSLVYALPIERKDESCLYSKMEIIL